MLANNETGTIQPVAEAARCAAGSAPGCMSTRCRRQGASRSICGGSGPTSLAVSSHKLGGPPGAGALLIAAWVRRPGADYRRRARSAGAAAAPRPSPPSPGSPPLRQAAPCRPLHLRRMAEDAATACGGLVLGGPDRLPNTMCVALPGVAAQTQLIALDLVGVQVSAGAACSSGKVARSHVLEAMGVGPLAGEAIRVSLPWNATAQDVHAFAAAYARHGSPPRAQGGVMRPGRPVYLDNQATTPCDPRVVAAMLPFFTERFGNAHSAEHAMGQDADDAVETARGQVAALIGADAARGRVHLRRDRGEQHRHQGRCPVRGQPGVEPPPRDHGRDRAQMRAGQRARAARRGLRPGDPAGRRRRAAGPDRLAAALAEPTVLVSVMAANNETGVLQDLPSWRPWPAPPAPCSTRMRRRRSARSRSTSAGVDLASFSAHKLYGPKGVGALYVRRRPRVRLQPLFSGGGQERGLRSGHPADPVGGGLRRGLPHRGRGDGGGSGPHRPPCGTGCWPGCRRAAGPAGQRLVRNACPATSTSPCRIATRWTLCAPRRSFACPPAPPAPRPRWRRPTCCPPWGWMPPRRREACASAWDALPPPPTWTSPSGRCLPSPEPVEA